MPLEPVFTRDCGGRVHFTDEPTGALDSRSAGELLDVFQEENEQGQTILMVTHSVQAASRANRVLFLRDGRLAAQLRRRPGSDFYQEVADGLAALGKGGRRSA